MGFLRLSSSTGQLVCKLFGAEPESEEFYEDLIKTRKPTPALALGHLIITFLFGLMAYPAAPNFLILTWMACMLSMVLIRHQLHSKIYIGSNIEPSDKLYISTSVSVLSGLVQGASLVLFAYLEPIEKSVFSIVLVGLCAGAVSATVGHRPSYVPYASSLLLPLALCWLTADDPNTLIYVRISVCFLLLILLAGLIANASAFYQQYKKSYLLRVNQVELNDKISAALNDAITSTQRLWTESP